MIKNLIKYFASRKKFNYLNKKIAALDIEKSEVDECGDPFVKLTNGFFFYSIKTVPGEYKYYSLLPPEVKKKLPVECYHAALDIIIRYFEGGLKLNGPRKEALYSVKKGDVIAEMGAYLGHYSLYLSEKIGSDGKLVAIEPMRDNLRILKKNITANNIKNTLIIPSGVWKEKAILSFSRKRNDTQSGSVFLTEHCDETMELSVDSLDNILSEQNIEKINFMIIQLNGVEVEALEGMKKFSPDNIAIAARYSQVGKSSVDTISGDLSSRGYQVYVREKNYLYANKAG